MQDFSNEKNSPRERQFARDADGNTIDDDPDTFDPSLIDAQPRRTGPTGPRTPAGKAISSLNGLDHGCCSKIAILPDEDPAEFDFIRNSWIERYEPDDDFAWLVDETVLAYWHYKRASKRLFELESNLPTNANSWTDDHHKRFSNFSRYKTTEERRFNRFYKELEAYDNKIIRRGEAKDRAWNEVSKINARWLKAQEERAAEELIVTQFIDVSIVDGKCVTECYPSNDEVLKQAALVPRPPLIVKRLMEFGNGVPPEYEWVNANHLQKIGMGMAAQKMLYKHWLLKIKEEEVTGTGHIGPFINYPKPPPDPLF